MAPPAKRRIQPQLISPSHAQPAAIGSNLNAVGFQSSSPFQNTNQTQLTHGAVAAPRVPDLKEDSELASKLGMKGRRIYVTIDKGQPNEVYFKKVSYLYKRQLLRLQ